MSDDLTALLDAELRVTRQNRWTQLADAAKQAEVTYRQADHWARSGYIRPLHYTRHRQGRRLAANGSGTSRYLKPREVEILMLMARLVRAGFSTAEAARLARLSVTENITVLPLFKGTGLVLLVGPR
jgi:hypothetical protein